MPPAPPTRDPWVFVPFLLSALVPSLGGGLPAAQRQPPPTLEFIAEIGCEDCEGPSQFSWIEGLALLDGGDVVVLDRTSPMLRIFTPEGASRATAGRAGNGPGELRQPLGIAPLGDGFVVADARRLALLRYDGVGRLVEETRMRSAPMSVAGSPRGRWLAFQEAQWSTMSASVQLRDAAFGPPATILGSTVGELLDSLGRPVAPGLLSVAVDDQGRVAIGHGDRYDITVRSPTGVLLRHVRRDLPRVRRTPEEITALQAAQRRFREAQGGRNPEGGPPRPISPVHQHFGQDALGYDPTGRLWLRSPRGGADRTIFDVFAANGQFLGEVAAPRALGEFTIRGDRLAAVSTNDESGIQTVTLWRIV